MTGRGYTLRHSDGGLRAIFNSYGLRPGVFYSRVPGGAGGQSSGNGAGNNSHVNGGGDSFVEGKATVLELHNELAFALLDINGKQVYGYWEADPSTAQTSTITRSGPWGSAVGVANEPIVHHQDFPAKPGDTIAFRGLRTGSDIYLTGVRVLSTK